MENAPDPKERKAIQEASKLSAIGWELAIAVIGCLLLGWWADKKFGTSPWLTLLGIVLGSAAGLWSVIRQAMSVSRNIDKDLKP